MLSVHVYMHYMLFMYVCLCCLVYGCMSCSASLSWCMFIHYLCMFVCPRLQSILDLSIHNVSPSGVRSSVAISTPSESPVSSTRSPVSSRNSSSMALTSQSAGTNGIPPSSSNRNSIAVMTPTAPPLVSCLWCLYICRPFTTLTTI